MKIGLIGCGRWGENIRKTLDELGVLGGVYDIAVDKDCAPVVTKVFGYSDAVCIATPAEKHYDHAKHLLESNKHVFVEKPIALKVEEARELATLAESKNLVLMVGHLMHYHNGFRKMKELVDKGAIGKIIKIEATRHGGIVREHEDVYQSLAPHDVSMMLALGHYIEPNSISVEWGDIERERVFKVTGTLGHVVLVGDLLGLNYENIPYEHNQPLQDELSSFCSAVVHVVQTGRVAKFVNDGWEALRVTQEIENLRTGTFVHSSAVIDGEIGTGTKVWHNSHISGTVGKNCTIGQNVYIGPGAGVSDGCKIQNNVFIPAGVSLAPNVFVGPGVTFTNVRKPRTHLEGRFEETYVLMSATIGANATIRCGIKIGQDAFIAAGAIVTKDVAPAATIMGVAAR
jgi:UDP-2-acetamido-3-amino-2,3-dideoxy-glucuronate N-acetyltransferase